jgi:hypothetical protein
MGGNRLAILAGVVASNQYQSQLDLPQHAMTNTGWCEDIGDMA